MKATISSPEGGAPGAVVELEERWYGGVCIRDDMLLTTAAAVLKAEATRLLIRPDDSIREGALNAERVYLGARLGS